MLKSLCPFLWLHAIVLLIYIRRVFWVGAVLWLPLNLRACQILPLLAAPPLPCIAPLQNSLKKHTGAKQIANLAARARALLAQKAGNVRLLSPRMDMRSKTCGPMLPPLSLFFVFQIWPRTRGFFFLLRFAF
jgi:hypothetical protein